MANEFSFGVEEEYFLVNEETKSLQRKIPASFLSALKRAIGSSVTREMLQSQIEISTQPLVSMKDAYDEVKNLRQRIGSVAAEHGLSYFAAGTHPTATWTGGQQTPKVRYEGLMNDFQMLGERNLLCGMHVHVELPDPGRRVEVMRRMLPFLPLFIALSTSSPFWRSRRTGLMGYRLAAYDELPRTGLPELFETNEDYEAYMSALIDARVITDSSYVWWTIRPSANHPTLELRAPDVCTRAEDAIALAALYRALARHLFNHPELNREITVVDRAIAVENKWRAQRYGVAATFVDPFSRSPLTLKQWLDQVFDFIAADIDALGCAADIRRLHRIAVDGTSADSQIDLFTKARAAGRRRLTAIKEVVDWAARETQAVDVKRP